MTEAGRRLARLYSESDLLAAECLRHGVWDALTAPELAAVVSALVFEARRDGPSEPRVPAGAVTDALAETARLWAELEADERRHKLERTRPAGRGLRVDGVPVGARRVAGAGHDRGRVGGQRRSRPATSSGGAGR